MMLLLALAAPVLAVEPVLLTIAGGRVGTSSQSLDIEPRHAPSEIGGAHYTIVLTVTNPGQKPVPQRVADSRTCPKAALILGAPPVANTAANPPPARGITVVADGRTYTLVADVLRSGEARQSYALRGRTGSPLAWWAEELMTALSVCWADRRPS